MSAFQGNKGKEGREGKREGGEGRGRKGKKEWSAQLKSKNQGEKGKCGERKNIRELNMIPIRQAEGWEEENDRKEERQAGVT